MIVVPIIVFLFTPITVTYYLGGRFIGMTGPGYFPFAFLLVVVVPVAFGIGMYLNYVTIPLFLACILIFLPYYLIKEYRKSDEERMRERLEQ